MSQYICPVCDEEAISVARTPATPCRCPQGHEWFYCLAHRPQRPAVLGKYVPGDSQRCRCLPLKPSEPTDRDMLVRLIEEVIGKEGLGILLGGKILSEQPDLKSWALEAERTARGLWEQMRQANRTSTTARPGWTMTDAFRQAWTYLAGGKYLVVKRCDGGARAEIHMNNTEWHLQLSPSLEEAMAAAEEFARTGKGPVAYTVLLEA